MDKRGHFYSISDLADILGVSEKTIRRHIQSGKLSSKKIGGIHRIPKESFKNFLAFGSNKKSHLAVDHHPILLDYAA